MEVAETEANIVAQVWDEIGIKNQHIQQESDEIKFLRTSLSRALSQARSEEQTADTVYQQALDASDKQKASIAEQAEAAIRENTQSSEQVIAKLRSQLSLAEGNLQIANDFQARTEACFGSLRKEAEQFKIHAKNEQSLEIKL